MAKRTEIYPDWPWTKSYRIAPGVRVGDTVYVSGTVAFDPEGNVVGGDDMRAQAAQVFANVRTVLAEAGAAMEDVVKITVFLTDMGRFAEFAAARAEAFPESVPAGTTVATPALVRPELLVEVEAVAVIGSGAGA